MRRTPKQALAGQGQGPLRLHPGHGSMVRMGGLLVRPAKRQKLSPILVRFLGTAAADCARRRRRSNCGAVRSITVNLQRELCLRTSWLRGLSAGSCMRVESWRIRLSQSHKDDGRKPAPGARWAVACISQACHSTTADRPQLQCK
jgi:hypothetical protein